MAAPSEKDLQAFCQFLNERRTLIADTSSASRVRLAATLSELGVRSSNLTLTSNYEEAEEAFRTVKPQMVLSDYNLGNRFGLDLLQSARTDAADSVFILITGNTSQNAVARAAEEDVDSFILKPYTLETLKNALITAVLSKAQPSEYMKAIRLGKDQLFGGKMEEAVKTLEAALKLDSSPTLAHFYLGYARKMKEALDDAENCFKDGLVLNKIHYKCLIGFYELLIQQKRHAEAYDVVKRIAQYFPANPKRLASVLRLAIMTEHYEDMEGYYRTFTQIDQRNTELVTYMCSALVVCGKYYIQKKHRKRAVEVFEKAAVSCAGQIRFLKYIIEALVDDGQVEAAVPFFVRYRASDGASQTYKTLEFMISTKKDPLATALSKGQTLLRAGVKEPLVLRLMIECFGKAGLIDPARNILDLALKLCPEKKLEMEATFAAFVKPKGSDAEPPIPATVSS